ncbi:hypothetical protein CFK39_09885 [Brachybacterium avium]|uniref:Uncharacterized protein n=1 Tax=Brachybacterium avium TaxID=2017485 RepID=A0A220UDU1_9MICO|nr:hypothetical protein [Brachybacterium avium]ASK66072.1 hypothetical protein CFK39_09885 [Brachybacterium avium]
MSTRISPVRPSAARLAGALLALMLVAAGCGESAPGPEQPPSSPAASDAGGSEPGASDDGGQTAAAVPQEKYSVTPAPEGFTPPEPCSGEGAYFAEVGGTATPELPERAGETLTITAEGIDGADAQLTATIGDGSSRPIQDITLGESVTIDLWTISVTSVCEDTQQVEFDLID